MDEGIDNDANRESDEIVQLPSISPGLESSEVYETANPRDASRQPVLKDSDGSLSSTNSTGTVIVRKTRDGRKRASYSAFPNTARPGSSKSNLSLSTPQKPVTGDTDGRDSSISPISPSSPVSFGHAMPHDRRISSVPLYASSQNSVNLQYPVIRPPSASASWYVHFEIIIFFVDGQCFECKDYSWVHEAHLVPQIIISRIAVELDPSSCAILDSTARILRGSGVFQFMVLWHSRPAQHNFFRIP